MLCDIVAFAQRTSALTFLLAVVVLSLFTTLVLQAVLGQLLSVYGRAVPMVAAQTVGIGCAVWLAQHFWPSSRPQPPVQVPAWLLSFLAGVALQFPLSAVGNLLQGVFPLPAEQVRFMYRLVYPNDAAAALLAALGIGILVPLCEEWLYRHTVLRRLFERFDEGSAIAVSALLFGLVHFAPHAIVAAGLAGLVLGWLYLRFGLGASIAFHTGVNLVPFVLRPTWLPIEGFNVEDGPMVMPTYLWVFGLMVGCILLFFLFRTYASGPVETRGPG